MIKIENKRVFSTEGKSIHRIGSDVYFRRGTVLPSDSEADFEEVDAVPAFTKAQYDDKVAELVRERYSASEEFALQRKAINAAFSPATLAAADSSDASGRALEEYAAYNAYIEQCKARALDPALYAEPTDDADAPGHEVL